MTSLPVGYLRSGPYDTGGGSDVTFSVPAGFGRRRTPARRFRGTLPRMANDAPLTTERSVTRPSSAQRQARHIQMHMPGTEIRTIFDVGANVGDTAVKYRQAYPAAVIWAFEPVNATFRELERIAADGAGIRAFNVALGASDEEGRITAVGTSRGNGLVAGPASGPVQPVEIVRGDTFCRAHRVTQIDLLKIDTEGSDLDVLRGFHDMLGDGRIDLVYVEAGMHVDNAKHVPLERFKGYLEPIGYRVFKIYNQSAERRAGPHLRRADVMFVSGRMIERHAGRTG